MIKILSIGHSGFRGLMVTLSLDYLLALLGLDRENMKDRIISAVKRN